MQKMTFHTPIYDHTMIHHSEVWRSKNAGGETQNMPLIDVWCAYPPVYTCKVAKVHKLQIEHVEENVGS